MNISSDTIVGICSTILGTILGWLLNSFSNNIGKIDICIPDLNSQVNYRKVFTDVDEANNMIHQHYMGSEPESIRISFTAFVTNKKAISSGMNSCKVYIECKNKRYDIIDMLNEGDSLNEFENLLNIEGKTTKKVLFKQTTLFWGEKDIEEKGYDIYLEYKVNGSSRIRKKLLKKVTANHQ